MGAGAIGGVFGGLLRKAGHDVALVGQRGYMEAIARRGLRISGIWGGHVAEGLRLHEKVGEVAGQPFEVVLLSVKSYDTERAMQELAAAELGGDPIVVSLQNGLGNVETIAYYAGADHTVGGRVIFGAEVVEPGHCRVTVYAEEVMLGEFVRDAVFLKESIEALADAITKAGIPTLYTDRIEAYLWGKILYNCSLNPTATLRGWNYGKLGEHEETREILRNVVEEIYAVAAKCRVDLLVPTPGEYLDLLLGRLIRSTYHHRPSMLQDIEAGRRTEIDAMNGMIVRYGRECGVPTPTNEFLTNEIKALEQKMNDEV